MGKKKDHTIKTPVSSYKQFVAREQVKLKVLYPFLSPGQITGKIKQKWQALKMEEKKFNKSPDRLVPVKGRKPSMTSSGQKRTKKKDTFDVTDTPEFINTKKLHDFRERHEEQYENDFLKDDGWSLSSPNNNEMITPTAKPKLGPDCADSSADGLNIWTFDDDSDDATCSDDDGVLIKRNFDADGNIIDNGNKLESEEVRNGSQNSNIAEKNTAAQVETVNPKLKNKDKFEQSETKPCKNVTRVSEVVIDEELHKEVIDEELQKEEIDGFSENKTSPQCIDAKIVDERNIADIKSLNKLTELFRTRSKTLTDSQENGESKSFKRRDQICSPVEQKVNMQRSVKHSMEKDENNNDFISCDNHENVSKPKKRRGRSKSQKSESKSETENYLVKDDMMTLNDINNNVSTMTPSGDATPSSQRSTGTTTPRSRRSTGNTTPRSRRSTNDATPRSTRRSKRTSSQQSPRDERVKRQKHHADINPSSDEKQIQLNDSPYDWGNVDLNSSSCEPDNSPVNNLVHGTNSTLERILKGLRSTGMQSTSSSEPADLSSQPADLSSQPTDLSSQSSLLSEVSNTKSNYLYTTANMCRAQTVMLYRDCFQVAGVDLDIHDMFSDVTLPHKQTKGLYTTTRMVTKATNSDARSMSQQFEQLFNEDDNFIFQS